VLFGGCGCCRAFSPWLLPAGVVALPWGEQPSIFAPCAGWNATATLKRLRPADQRYGVAGGLFFLPSCPPGPVAGPDPDLPGRGGWWPFSNHPAAALLPLASRYQPNGFCLLALAAPARCGSGGGPALPRCRAGLLILTASCKSANVRPGGSGGGVLCRVSPTCGLQGLGRGCPYHAGRGAGGPHCLHQRRIVFSAKPPAGLTRAAWAVALLAKRAPVMACPWPAGRRQTRRAVGWLPMLASLASS